MVTIKGLLRALKKLEGKEMTQVQKKALAEVIEALDMDKELKDLDRLDFLKALDKADFELSDWEARFVASNLTRTYFTFGQIEVIEELMEKYKKRLR